MALKFSLLLHEEETCHGGLSDQSDLPLFESFVAANAAWGLCDYQWVPGTELPPFTGAQEGKRHKREEDGWDFSHLGHVGTPIDVDLL
ncbi:uncharacterized protein LAJ45_10489 [Morchella importuna]|uniref:uncharacterized protein n=1 Tax=Morchella importuna TaxID=1174673 RepID=UPI001E8D0849|nr:uncharacterized protein LAJ45_10489 [Morchella importuna]KAH8145519.1 hypothetical protein LAJ45_10489 [Morchella importuna]